MYTYKLVIKDKIIFSCDDYFKSKCEVRHAAKKCFHDKQMELISGAAIKYIYKVFSNASDNTSNIKDNEIFIESHKYFRYNKHYTINEVLDNVDINKKHNKHNFDGDIIRLNSSRYFNFKYNGIVCKKCGLKGQYFCKERAKNDTAYHFNLYGINEKGEEIMLTKDHIIPKSKGGENVITNYQCLCERCNSQKGNLDDNIFMNGR